MGSLAAKAALLAGALLATAVVSNAGAPAAVPMTIRIAVGAAIAETEPEYVSVNLDWHLDTEESPAWTSCGLLSVNLSNPALRYLTAQLAAAAPMHLRLGGSEGDNVTYELPNTPPCPPGTTFCLTAARWAEINAFADAVNASIAFGLNAMYGRASSSTPFDPANTAALLNWTAAQGYIALRVLEFGNELQTKIAAVTYAKDALVVRALIDKAWAHLPPTALPALVANDENPDPGYWSTILPLVGGALHAATWHLYVGYGLDPALPQKAFDASFLAQINSTAAAMVAAATAAKFPGRLWVGETAMAWHSGRNGTTNSYLSGPWYIAQLGSLAGTHSVQCRQTLLGGYYELIDHNTTMPNPDYWTALLWKRTMGTRVLTTWTSGAPSADRAGLSDVLAFAHCTAPSVGAPAGAVSVAWVNLSPNSTYAPSLAGLAAGGDALPRWEYVLTPGGSDDTGLRHVLLNGSPLAFNGSALSPTPPLIVSDAGLPWQLPPRTYGFTVFPAAAAAGCE